MAERLTKRNKPTLKCQMEDNISVNEDTAIKRLWKYENIMGKYGIESLDTLEHIIKKGKAIIAIADNVSINEVLQKDRDTWQKACELALKEGYYAEKDKEIEELKQNNKIFMQLVEETKSKNIDDFVFLVRVMNGSYIQKLRKANRRVQELEQSQTQLAIQELEKVKQTLNNEELMVFSTPEMIIDQQIKELKGE